MFRLLIYTISTLLIVYFFIMLPRPPRSPLFPYTTLFRSRAARRRRPLRRQAPPHGSEMPRKTRRRPCRPSRRRARRFDRSEEHTSELQSRPHLVCRLLLEKKKKKDTTRLDLIPNTHLH